MPVFIGFHFPVMLSELVTFTSEDAAGLVYRLGLIFFRLCMIFSALRKYENGEMSSTIICTDEDFNTVMQIVQTYPPLEIAVRFKHRIVSIHCFPNGNGRHSRLMTDIIIEKIYKQLHYSCGAAGQPTHYLPQCN